MSRSGAPAGVSAAAPDPAPWVASLGAPAQGGGQGFLEQGVEPGMEQRSH